MRAGQGGTCRTCKKTVFDSGLPCIGEQKPRNEGITRARLPKNNDVICTLHDAKVPPLAKAMGNTRSAAALGVEPGSPSMTVVRRYRDERGQLLCLSVTEHAGDRYTFAQTLRRAWDTGSRGRTPD